MSHSRFLAARRIQKLVATQKVLKTISYSTFLLHAAKLETRHPVKSWETVSYSGFPTASPTSQNNHYKKH